MSFSFGVCCMATKDPKLQDVMHVISERILFIETRLAQAGGNSAKGPDYTVLEDDTIDEAPSKTAQGLSLIDVFKN
jgi:hypothetical protein